MAARLSNRSLLDMCFPLCSTELRMTVSLQREKPGSMARCPGPARLRRSGIDDGGYLADSISRETTTLGVLPDGLLVGSDVDAVNLFAGDVALYPLDFRSHGA